MGATPFMTKAKGKTAAEAFKAAVDEALHDYGHRGYTGTIAEKKISGFVELEVPEAWAMLPERFARMKMQEERPQEEGSWGDKWGPAACVRLGLDEWLFFGTASC